MSVRECLNHSGPQNRQSCWIQIYGSVPPPPKILLSEPRKQSRSVLGYPADIGLQTWNAKSMMPKVHIQINCATYLVTCR